MNRAWLPVLVGGVMETVWSCTMKLSEGFSDPLYTALTLVFLVVSVLFLNSGLRSGLQMGVCYAVWVGIGAAGSAVAGLAVFNDQLTAMGAFFLVLMISAIVAMELMGDEGSSG
ncbi:MAG: hypothetical protein IKR86_05500 [Candidatus Methanomethylophilaceae archaeon]|nr:hypothetical protein [Candidatus Methanomethylophilaceae archaeon]